MLHVAPAVVELAAIPSVTDLISAERRAHEAARLASDDERVAALEEQEKAFSDVMSARPGDAAGVIAMLDLFLERETENLGDPLDHYAEQLFNGIRTFLKGLPRGAYSDAPATAADAELIFRGLLLDDIEARKVAWADANPGDDNPHFDPSWTARKHINDLPGRSLLGLAAKARAALYAKAGDEDVDCLGEGSFVGLSTSICADILRMAGGVVVDPVDPAEAAFSAWLDRIDHYNRPKDLPDEEDQALWQTVIAAGFSIFDCPASPQTAAAIVLHELAYRIDENRAVNTVSEALQAGMYEERESFAILRALRPLLKGRVGDLASDILDHPDRLLTESDLFKAFSGASSAPRVFREAAE